MKELNDFLLNLFTSSDSIRPYMMFPNLKNGIVYASDGNVLISIPENELTLKYKTDDKYPNAGKTIEDFESKKLSSIKVKVSDIAKELVKARIQFDRYSVKCKECKGTGEVEWEYTSKDGDRHYKDNDCPECEGDGSSDKTHPFARVSLDMIEDEDTGYRAGISIGELYFHPFQLYRLFMVALIKGCESIEIFFDNKRYGNIIARFGNIKVLVALMTKQK